MKSNLLIGIDPDCDKSGFSVINAQHYEITTLTFFDMFKRFKELIIHYGVENINVYVECGFLNKSNWHKKIGQSASLNTKIGERTGANFETAKKICEMCEYLGLKYYQIRPTRSKINAEGFKQLTKITKRTNQEMRDSFMLIFGR